MSTTPTSPEPKRQASKEKAMFIYTIAAPTTHRATVFAGDLEEMKEHLADQAHRYGWNFGDFTTWGLDAEELEAGETVPELTAENMRKFASTIWDISENHINLHRRESGLLGE